jgi:hypothetical protein
MSLTTQAHQVYPHSSFEGVPMATYSHVRFDKKSKSWFLDLWRKGEHIPLYRLPIADGDMWPSHPILFKLP